MRVRVRVGWEWGGGGLGGVLRGLCCRGGRAWVVGSRDGWETVGIWYVVLSGCQRVSTSTG